MIGVIAHIFLFAIISYVSGFYNSRLYVWGYCMHGECGRWDEIEFPPLEEIPNSLEVGIGNSTISSCSHTHGMFFLTESGEVYGLGENEYMGILPIPEPRKVGPVKVQLYEPIGEIQCGMMTVVVKSSSKRLYGWGQETSSLGINKESFVTRMIYRPKTLNEGIMEDRMVEYYKYGFEESILLAKDVKGSLRFISSGNGERGELGIGRITSPYEISNWTFMHDEDLLKELKTGSSLVTITSGRDFVFALFSNHHLYFWGDSFFLGCSSVTEHLLVDGYVVVPTLWNYVENDCSAQISGLTLNYNYTVYSEIDSEPDNILCSSNNCYYLGTNGKLFSWGRGLVTLGRGVEDFGQVPRRMNMSLIDPSLGLFERMSIFDSTSFSLLYYEKKTKSHVLYGLGYDLYDELGKSGEFLTQLQLLYPLYMKEKRVTNSFVLSTSTFGRTIMIAAPNECFEKSGLQACNYPIGGVCGRDGECECLEGYSGKECFVVEKKENGKEGFGEIINQIVIPLGVALVVFICFLCCCLNFIALLIVVVCCFRFLCKTGVKALQKMGDQEMSNIKSMDHRSEDDSRLDEGDYNLKLPEKDDGSIGIVLSDKEVFSPSPTVEGEMSDPFLVEEIEKQKLLGITTI